jgi:Protein of unknown function C-terminus (DUF2399)
MGGVDEARYLALWREQGRRDHWRDLVGRLFVPGWDLFDVLGRSMAGHEWYRLPGYDGYLAACSCGWRSVDTHRLDRMPRQVKDHLHAARQAKEAPAGVAWAIQRSLAQASMVTVRKARRRWRALRGWLTGRCEAAVSAAHPLTPLVGEPAATPWDPELAAVMRHRNVRIEEELTLDTPASRSQYIGRVLVPNPCTYLVRLFCTVQKGVCGSGHQCQRGPLAPVPPHPASQ